jgi:hypothetical protein
MHGAAVAAPDALAARLVHHSHGPPCRAAGQCQPTGCDVDNTAVIRGISTRSRISAHTRPGPSFPANTRVRRLHSRALARPIEAAVVALEYQHNGWPHFHPLLRLPGGLQGHELEQLGSLWFDRHGYAQLSAGPFTRSRGLACSVFL